MIVSSCIPTVCLIAQYEPYLFRSVWCTALVGLVLILIAAAIWLIQSISTNLVIRVTWSVACAIACLLVAALYLRSLWHIDYIQGPIPGPAVLVVGSMNGAVFVERSPTDAASVTWYKWERLHVASDRVDPLWLVGFQNYSFGKKLFVPVWMLVLLFSALTASPWVSCRFSLRMLLIVTSLVAVALGFAVYALKMWDQPV